VGAVAVVLAGGCGAASKPSKLPADYLPLPVGRAPAFRVRPVSPAAARRAPIARLRCTNVHPGSFGIHLELYAHRLVIPVPAGIGIAPPQRRRGVYVLGGRCSYPIRTLEPTGVVVVDHGSPRTLRELSAVWGQPIARDRLAGFRGRVLAFLGGRRWRGDPARIPLHRHAEIVLEIDGYVPPHPAYRFPPGL
jgi:hypothetical protein